MLPLSLLLLLTMAPFSGPDLSLQNQLRQEYVGSQRMLRHFSAADKLTFDDAGEPLNEEQNVSWTLGGAVAIENLRVQGKKLELQGRRRMVTFDHQNKQLVFKKWDKKVWIEVGTNDGPDQDHQLRKALAKVFVESADLPDLLPEYWRDYMRRFLGRQSGGCETEPVEGGATSGGSQPAALASDGVAPGNLIKKAAPYYLPAARKAGVPGDVELHAFITTNGTVRDICLVKALGAGLDDSGIDAVRQWQYKPYLLDGHPVEVDTTIKITFRK